MISYIKGSLIEKSKDHIVLLVNNSIGYQIILDSNKIMMLQEQHDYAFWIHQSFKQDNQELFGFETLAQKQLFQKIIKISGVGPRLGITIISAYDISTLSQIIINKDLVSLTKITGVGKKTAERLILEMQNLIINIPASNNAHQESFAALISLGFKAQDIHKALQKIPSNINSNQDIIKATLKELKS
jgi:Holliday junction DNA helicase RuvA